MRYWGIIFVLILFNGCTANDTAGDRAILESSLFISNAENIGFGSYPLKFDLLRGQTYTLEHVSEKVSYATDGEMLMNVSLPNEFHVIDGNLEWSGTDRWKSNKITFISTENGDYLIESETVNFGDFNNATGKHRTASSKISVSMKEPTITLMIWHYTGSKINQLTYRYFGKRIL